MSPADGDLIGQILAALRMVLGDARPGLHEPVFCGNEIAYLKECVETGWVSSAGKFVDRFEDELARYIGVARAVATVNGTAALHICLELAGVRPGDEVLVPTLTFVGTLNAVHYTGAVPHFVDSDEATLGVDPEKLGSYLRRIAVPGPDGPVNRQTGRPLRALVPVHAYGHPVDLDAICAVCEAYGLVLVEDAAESVGSFYRGVHTGTRGRLAALSFNGNKTITTGGGGAVLTNDAELGRLAKHITTTAKRPHRWAFYHDVVGYNYRMPNINAALGCAQLEQLEEFLAAKRALAGRYLEAFAGVAGAHVFEEPSFARSNYWLNVLLLDEDREHLLEAVLAATNDAGIATRPAWTLMHKLPMYCDCPRMDLSTAERLERRLINLPSGVGAARSANPRTRPE